jgi:hypothetical protein
MAAIRAAEQEWERVHRGMVRPLPSEFAAIREALSGIPLQTITEAIGVSRTAAPKIRSESSCRMYGTGKNSPGLEIGTADSGDSGCQPSV